MKPIVKSLKGKTIEGEPLVRMLPSGLIYSIVSEHVSWLSDIIY